MLILWLRSFEGHCYLDHDPEIFVGSLPKSNRLCVPMNVIVSPSLVMNRLKLSDKNINM